MFYRKPLCLELLAALMALFCPYNVRPMNWILPMFAEKDLLPLIAWQYVIIGENFGVFSHISLGLATIRTCYSILYISVKIYIILIKIIIVLS